MGAGGSSALQELRDVAANYDEHAGQGAHEHDLRALLQPKTSRLREQAQGFRRRLSKRLSKQQLETIVPAGGESENDSSAEAAEEAARLLLAEETQREVIPKKKKKKKKKKSAPCDEDPLVGVELVEPVETR